MEVLLREAIVLHLESFREHGESIPRHPTRIKARVARRVYHQH